MNADGSEQLTFVEGGADLLDRIEPLWKQQTALHAEKSLHFAESFITASFSDRKSVFEQKARTGALLVVLAMVGSDEIAGYTVCSVCEELSDLGTCKMGEIDSMFIPASYRRLGFGRKFLLRSMEWFQLKPRGKSDCPRCRLVMKRCWNSTDTPDCCRGRSCFRGKASRGVDKQIHRG